MTADHAAFVRAICEHPGDNLPRLIFADYLDERGEAARAEFIRLQIAMATCKLCIKKDGTPRAGYWPVNCARCKPGRIREEKLIYGERVSWHDWVPKFDGLGFSLDYPSPITSQAPSARFTRGFLHTIRCTASLWLAHGQEILRQQPVEAVHFSDGNGFQIQHAHGHWNIWLHTNLNYAAQSATFPTRAALIEAMPATLEQWGIGWPNAGRTMHRFGLLQEIAGTA